MLTHPFSSGVWVSIALVGLAHAHQGPYHAAAYCLYGPDPNNPDYNNNLNSQPLYQMAYNDYWMHNYAGCKDAPPADGVFLDLVPGKNATLEIAENVSATTYGKYGTLSDWGDGKEHPDDYHNATCITSPNLHCTNETNAAGTVLAIAYSSDIYTVTPDDFTVFSVAPQTPWKRLVNYSVPLGMPPCPEEGCICAYGWGAYHCGTPNMYIFPIRCRVVNGTTPAKTIGKPQHPVWCEDDQSQCVTGPKTLMIWNQAEKNNMNLTGYDLNGQPKTPMYNEKCGFLPGAQNDIFVNTSGISALPSATAGSSSPASSGTPALPSMTSGSSSPAWSGASALPSMIAGSSSPAWSGISALPSTTPESSLPAGSGTSTDPYLPTGSSTCKRSLTDTIDSGHAAHSKRMMRREKNKIF